MASVTVGTVKVMACGPVKLFASTTAERNVQLAGTLEHGCVPAGMGIASPELVTDSVNASAGTLLTASKASRPGISNDRASRDDNARSRCRNGEEFLPDFILFSLSKLALAASAAVRHDATIGLT